MKNLLDMDLEEIEAECLAMGEKKFRAKQIYAWLMAGVPFEQMNNLSISLRQKLRDTYHEGFVKTVRLLTSKDGTKKYLLQLADGNVIESVLMKYEHGNTVCLSTQAGCRMGCAFCASCEGGLKRNLSAGEMLAQIIRINADMGTGRNITNIVLMGTGEPLDNYDNVVKFLRLVHSDAGFGISYRNISLSTCGLVKELKNFIRENIPITLCISLHAANDEKRRQLIPMARKYSITELIAAAKDYFETTGRRIIFEYILMKDFNDTEKDKEDLKRLLADIICHINIIPYNTVAGKSFQAPSKSEAYAFAKSLEMRGISATVRRALGADIAGACGQLRSSFLKNGG